MPSHRKEITEAYFEGFRRSDHEAILALLTEDVVWEIHGHVRLEGRAEFDGEIENKAFDGPPELTVEQLIEDGESVAVPHHGRGRLAAGGDFEFAGVTILGFRGELIESVDSYIVPLGG